MRWLNSGGILLVIFWLTAGFAVVFLLEDVGHVIMLYHIVSGLATVDTPELAIRIIAI
jgi:hypothetical protein